MDKYKGCFIRESLNDENILKKFRPIKIVTTDETTDSDRWHIYYVNVIENEIKSLHQRLKEGYYMHFWNDKNLIVLFKDRKFTLDINKKETWKACINYGLSIGIPEEQLDFKTEF